MNSTPGIEPFYKQLGKRIRDARNALGISQQDLGDYLEPPVTRSCVANMETGKQRILTHTMLQLADALGASPNDLLFMKRRK